MRSYRPFIFSVVGVLLVLIATSFAHHIRTLLKEGAHIRVRYQQMRIALSLGDTNAARALVAPAFRVEAQLGRLATFTKPLGPNSAVRFSNSRATITPERILHYGVFPFGGHKVTMVKIDGEWYFDGGVQIY
jgi:hypothetical protein